MRFIEKATDSANALATFIDALYASNHKNEELL